MKAVRKSAETRAKELRLAIFRIERGRSHTQATKLSIAAVAREVGVTPALIHSHYPLIADEIRIKQGASSRDQRNAKQGKLKQEREKSKALRQERDELKDRIAKLASINEMLLLENRALRATSGNSNVVQLGAKSSENS